MIRLDTTTRKLQALLAGAVTTNQLQVTVCYSDKTSTTYTGGTSLTLTNNTTAVDICAAPAASTVRDIDYIGVVNTDTVSATVSVYMDNSGTDYLLAKATLGVGEQLTYVHGSGWNTVGSTGDVFGPASATDNALARFDGTTGKLVQDSAVTLSDAGVFTFADGTQVASSNLFGDSNVIIGGNFSTNPWQRGTSFTAVASGAYTADRVYYSASTTAVINVLKTVDSPTAAEAGVFTQHCFHVDVTTADASIAASDIAQIQLRLEGLNVASFGFGKAGTRYVIASFWHKHTVTGQYCVSLRNSAADRSYVAEYTQDVADTWEEATITIPVDTSGTWLYDTGVGLNLSFSLACGTDRQTTANTWTAGNFIATANQVNALDSTANNFKIALVRLDPGTVPGTSWRSVGQELALCQRYYYRIFPGAVTKPLGTIGYNPSNSSHLSTVPFQTQMRIAPSALEQSGVANNYMVNSMGINTQCTSAPTFSAATQTTGVVQFGTGATLTSAAGGAAWTDITNGAAAYLGWSAEL